ncbi:RNA-binding protein [Planctomycetales bacterium ZRK34]|nr:RNA-binding protein [Planctomycetales bacterium ZRK34]
MMSLLVRNLPPGWNDHEVGRLFGVFGQVARIAFVFDRAGSNARCAFVDMTRTRDAARAVKSLNGRRFARHQLMIENYAPY